MAVNGLSSAELATYHESTPFITMDGRDIYLVLDGRVRLDDLLRAKRPSRQRDRILLPVGLGDPVHALSK